MISVVIPTYNRARYLFKAIDSVLAQTYKNYEIIIVDDGSTDNTVEVVQPYLSRIKYIYQDNKGVSSARNTGIRAAKRKWIAFLDSDDEWLPRKLEFQMIDLQQFPDAVMSCTNILFEGVPGTASVDFFKNCLSFDVKQSLFVRESLFKGYACTSTVLAKLETIIDVGLFDEEISIYEDTDLFFRLSTKGGVVVNPKVLAKAFRRNESESINLSAQFLVNKEMNYKSLIKIYRKLSKYDLSTMQHSLVKKQLSSSWFDLGIVYYNNKNHKQARHCFFKSLRAYPTGKNLAKLILGLIGQQGISFIEKNRQQKKGFRRSEYYNNDSAK